MAEKSRKVGRTKEHQAFAQQLVGALLDLECAALRIEGLVLEAEVHVEWAEKTLQVTGQIHRQSTNGRPKTETVGITKQDLGQILQKANTTLAVNPDKIQSALDALEQIGVLSDKQITKKGYKYYWQFKLHLEHQTATKEKNLKVIEQKWFRPQSVFAKLSQVPTAESSIPWREICNQVLATKRDLASNLFTQAQGIHFDLNDIHVPLGLVERKDKPRQKEDVEPELGSQVYQVETLTPIEYDQFFQEVLAQGRSPKSQGKRITIIGEPGAGKTTQLLKIAEWVRDTTDDLPIWISLAALAEKSLLQYLQEDWLTVAANKLTAAPVEWVNDLEKQLDAGRVWLLLDGADEMSVANPLGVLAQELRLPLLKNVRVVLSCRLNLWDAGANALSEFDSYKMLDFSYQDSRGQDQVKQFINRWFAEAELGESLRSALEQPGKERIKDLVRNPLRLSLLCLSWQWGQGQLPETKAGLYEVFFEALYQVNQLKGEDFSTTTEQRLALNQALGQLALTAIAKGFRSLLPDSLVQEVLAKLHPGLFDLACRLGWLNRVCGDPQNPLKSIYAFYHPTFQEYFAAISIQDWDFFLPREHVDRPGGGEALSDF